MNAARQRNKRYECKARRCFFPPTSQCKSSWKQVGRGGEGKKKGKMMWQKQFLPRIRRTIVGKRDEAWRKENLGFLGDCLMEARR